MSVREIYKTQYLLLFIFLLNNFSLKYVYMLSIKCNRQLYSTGCPFYAKCNKAIGLCRCKPEYPIHLSRHSLCLNYRELGQKCIHSIQCSKTSNAVCYDEDFYEFNYTQILSKRYLKKIAERDYDLEYGFENYGECKCKVCHNLFQ